MDDEKKKILQEYFANLPEEIQRALYTTDIRGILSTIAQKHNLRVDQAGELEDESLYIMLGLESSDDFVTNIQRALAVSHEEAVALAREVDEKLLHMVRESLMKLPEEADQRSGDFNVSEINNIFKAPIQTSTPQDQSLSQKTPLVSPDLSPIRTLPGDIARVKLQETVHMPHSSVTEPIPIIPKPVEKGIYVGSDPYRELVE